MSVLLFNDDNTSAYPTIKESGELFRLIYADMIYDNTNFQWIDLYSNLLDVGGIFIVQTDYHTSAELKTYVEEQTDLRLLNWCIYINDWGGVPKRGFPRKHDDILIFNKDENFLWYPDRIQIQKSTAGTVFDKKGTGLKTPPDVFYDRPSFSTVSRERIKTGRKNIRWQKPKWLMERLLLPFTDVGDNVLDLFMGTGTLGAVCKKYDRHYIGIESDTKIYELARDRIYDILT